MFENRVINQEYTTAKTLTQGKEWLQAHEKAEISPKTMASSVLKNPQVQPSENTSRCNTDAAWNKASKAAGLACIFRNNAGIEVHRASWNQYFFTSSLMAEAMAVRLAILTATSLDISDLQVRSDNQTLLRAITPFPCFHLKDTNTFPKKSTIFT